MQMIMMGIKLTRPAKKPHIERNNWFVDLWTGFT